MRVVAGFIGAVLGSILGVVIGLLVSIVTTHNDLLGIFFIGIGTMPAGVLSGSIVGTIAGLRLFYCPGEAESVGRIRTKRVVLLSTAVISSAAILMVLLVWITRVGMTPPSDERLLSNFDKHEATLNVLIEMLKTDRDLVRVAEDWTRPENPETIGVSAVRISTYRRLLRDARVRQGFQSEAFMYEVDFFYWGIGSAISSDEFKGYAYRKSPPTETRSSLNGYRPSPDPKSPDDTIKVYRHIRGDWYVFYEYIPG